MKIDTERADDYVPQHNREAKAWEAARARVRDAITMASIGASEMPDLCFKRSHNDRKRVEHVSGTSVSGTGNTASPATDASLLRGVRAKG
jgi:2-methylcitrate dehydratase PrpD